MNRESVISHLQIIHTWASFARERDLQFFTAKHLEKIAEWSNDAISLLKEQEAVVRCKDCEHATITTDGEYCKYCENYTDENGDPIEVYYSANWFCANGERKEGR